MSLALAPFIDVTELDRLCEADDTVVVVDTRWYLDGGLDAR